MEPAFNCKTECLLRDLLECKLNYLTTNEEKIAILVDQVAESRSPEKNTELSAAQEKQKSKTQELNKVLQCLINSCNQYYPETGTQYDSEVEVSEEEGEEYKEEDEESYGGKCASEKDSENSNDEY